MSKFSVIVWQHFRKINWATFNSNIWSHYDQQAVSFRTTFFMKYFYWSHKWCSHSYSFNKTKHVLSLWVIILVNACIILISRTVSNPYLTIKSIQVSETYRLLLLSFFLSICNLHFYCFLSNFIAVSILSIAISILSVTICQISVSDLWR